MRVDQPMSEREILATIERLELDVRETRRKVEHAANEAEKRTLNQRLSELQRDLKSLSHRLRP